ncbi:MAG: hypothetical protein HY749_16055 [Gammaproteobacteria bacterium]|nr:hypothetical protein [Gammaproteobacteria bacterium]
MLTFDPGPHQYYWDGQPVVNVTRVLESLTSYDKIPADVLTNAQQEGTAIHKMAELHFTGDLDVDALPDWMRPRYAALLRFIEETGFVVHYSERLVYHHRLRYAGTLDITGEAPRLKKVKGVALIDIKRSFFAGPAIGLQTAAYTFAHNQDCHPDERVVAKNRFALQLRADGLYRLEPYPDPEDFQAWLAALSLHRWKEKAYGRPAIH